MNCNKKRPTRAKEHSVMFTTTYTLNSRKVGDAVKKHWHVLSSDPALPAEFRNPPLIVNRRGCNLRDKLVHADCQPQKKISQALLHLLLLPNASYECRGCAQCNNMMKCEYFCHPHTEKRFQINDIITCSTTHVIYIIKCPCGLCHVGKTSCSLKERIIEHKSSIRRNDRDYPVTIHFNDLKHDISTFFRFCGIEKVKISDRSN